jgi:hypothetical protein
MLIFTFICLDNERAKKGGGLEEWSVLYCKNRLSSLQQQKMHRLTKVTDVVKKIFFKTVY